MSKTNETNQSLIEGKKTIEDILNFSEYKKKEKPSLIPLNCKLISPIECFQALVNKHDKKDIQNVYFMCLSFILQNEEEVNIGANSTITLLTNYNFKEKIRKRKVKNIAKSEEEIQFNNLTSEMKYHISSDFASNSFIQIQPQQGLLTDILDQVLVLKIANYSNEDYILPPKIALGKIYFYFQ